MADYFTRPIQSGRHSDHFLPCRKLSVEDKASIGWKVATVMGAVFVVFACIAGWSA